MASFLSQTRIHGGIAAAQNLTIVGSIANAAEFLRLEAWGLKINNG